MKKRKYSDGFLERKRGYASFRKRNRKSKRHLPRSKPVQNDESSRDDDFQRSGRRNRIEPESILRYRAKNNLLPKKPKRHELIVELPAIFSLIDDPESVMTVLNQVVVAASYPNLRCLKINYGNVIFLGLGADAILSRMISDLDASFRRQGRDVKLLCCFPDNLQIQTKMRRVGIVDAFKTKGLILEEKDVKEIRAFDKRSIESATQNRLDFNDYKTQVVKDFVEYVEECLKEEHRDLSLESKNHLAVYIGEIIGNAEEHPGFNDWTILGCLICTPCRIYVKL